LIFAATIPAGDNTGRAAPEILDALAPLGITNLTGPATPQLILRALRG